MKQWAFRTAIVLSVVLGAVDSLSAQSLTWLGTLGGRDSLAYGVSDNGAVAGWASNRNRQYRAFRWTQDGGMEDLNITYADFLTFGSVLQAAYAVSSDGRYIVGNGYNAVTQRYEAFLLDTWRTGDMNGDGCIDDLDLLAVLHAFDTPGTGYARHEDIDKDGIVDDADLLTVLSNFGGGCN